MASRRFRVAGALTVVTCLAAHAPSLAAQGIEVSPVSGYRFGFDLFETVAGQALDPDGAPAMGLVVDVPLSNGLQVEGLFTHQHAGLGFNLPRVSIDHWQGGGLQEFGGGRVRPFLTGTLGLTRYAADASNEIRFNLAAGGGVKLFVKNGVFVVIGFNVAPGSGLKTGGAPGDGGAFVFHFDSTPGCGTAFAS